MNETTDASPAEPLWKQFCPLLIAACAIIAYANSFSGVFLFDDVSRIVDNRAIRQLWPAGEIFTSDAPPMLYLSLALNHAISGLELWSYHLFNLLVHVAAGLALFGVVRRALLAEHLKARFAPSATQVALAIALIWVVHPLLTQSVTYVIQRSESMMGLCYLLTLYCVARGASSAWWNVAAVACCAVGVASKEVMITAPLVVLLYDRAFLAPSFAAALRRRARLYAGLAATWLIPPLMWLANVSQQVRSDYLEHDAGSAISYALTQSGVILHYLRLSLWPAPLCLDYGWPVAGSLAEVWLPTMVLLALGLATVAAWRAQPALGFLGAWFFIILGPTSSILPIPDAAFEHRMYLSLAAVVALSVITGRTLLRRTLRDWPGSPVAAGCAVGLVVVVLTGLTLRRNFDYHSAERMWGDVVAKRPHNPRGPSNLGDAVADAGRLEEAIVHFQHALQLNPDFGDAHYNLATTLVELGRYEESLPHFREAVRTKPGFGRAYYNMGIALAKLKRFDEALSQYGRAIDIDPQFADAYYNMGIAYDQLGRLGEAAACFRRSLEIQPDNAQACSNLGNVLAHTGDLQAAVASYKQALAIEPNYADAYYNMASAFGRQGNIAQAIAHYRQALACQPDYAEAHNNLGNLFAQSKDLPQARQHYQQAILLKPDYADAHNNLGNVYFQQGDTEQAIACYQQALRADQNFAKAHGNLGVVYSQLDQPAVALAHFQQALRLQPSFADAHYNMGNALVRLGRFEEALPHYRLAVQNQPDFAAAYFNWANNLVRLGRFEKAIAPYQQCLQLQPDNLQAHLNLADTYSQLGQHDQAVGHCQRALLINPNSSKARSKLQEIQALSTPSPSS